MSKVWITSDPHLGHKNIPKFRPQVNSTEHNSELFLENVLSSVNKRDTLWILGDILFDKEHTYVLEKISERVESLKIVLGNHCTEKKERRNLLMYLWTTGVVSEIHSLVSYKKCWLSHAPIHSEELRGKLCIHGHTHNHVINDSRYFNVCVDQTDMKPVLFTDIMEEFKSRGVIV